MAKAKPSDAAAAPKDGEHIFNATYLTPLAIEWQECVKAGDNERAMELLEELIKGCTQLFERFAQYEGYDSTVDLQTLVIAAQEKMVRWLMAWRPEKGKLFSWLSKCAKNAFRCEVVKVKSYRTRVHSTSDSLEKIHGAEDHSAFSEEESDAFKEKILKLTARWGSPQELGTIRYLIESVMMEHHDKRAAISGAAYAYGISPELAKFFYSWVLFALRNEMYEKAHVPFTEQDLLRHEHSYTHIPDMLEIISFDQLKKLIMTLGGQRIKIPTVNSLAKTRQHYLVYNALRTTDMDPDSVEQVGKRFGKTSRSAQEIFDEMSRVVDPAKSGEYDVYEHNP